MIPLSGTAAKESELMSLGSEETINLKALLFQTGYLTIEGYSETTKYYQLGFLNQAVREAFTDSLVRHFAPLNPQLSAKMRTLLEDHDLSAFFESIQQIFAEFPYHIFRKAQEHLTMGCS